MTARCGLLTYLMLDAHDLELALGAQPHQHQQRLVKQVIEHCSCARHAQNRPSRIPDTGGSCVDRFSAADQRQNEPAA
jgi:hypothetical protein